MKHYDFSNIEKIYVVGGLMGEFTELIFRLNDGFKEKIDDTILHPKEIEKRKIKEELLDRDNYLIHKPIFGSFDGMVSFENTNFMYSDALIISNGDNHIGFNEDSFYEKTFIKINEILAKNNTTLLLVRGNNDDPSFFSEEKINFSNVKTIPDYSVILTKIGNLLCVGGGISNDRIWRQKQEKRLSTISPDKKKRLYWENEGACFNEDEMKAISDSKLKISGVISHMPPTFVTTELSCLKTNWCINDPNLLKDIEKSRLVMDKIYRNLNEQNNHILFWFFSHYKLDNHTERNNVLFKSNPPFAVLSIYSELQKYQFEKERKKQTIRSKKPCSISDRNEAMENFFMDMVFVDVANH